MPHHCQSMGFGVDGLDYFKDGDGSWNIDALVDGSLDSCKMGLPPTKLGEQFKYSMPSYFVRKIFYNPDEWNLYQMNELGKEILSLRFDLSLKRASERISPYLASITSLKEHLAPLDKTDEEIDSIWNMIQSGVHGSDASDLALFDKVYRDIECEPGTDISISVLRDSALDFMLTCKSIDIEPRPEGVNYSKVNRRKGVFTFNDLPCFRGFDDVLTEIEGYEFLLGEKCHEAYVIKREREDTIKQYVPDPYILSNQMFFEV